MIPQAETLRAAVEPPAMPCRRILLVDAETDMLTVLRLAFGGLGAEIHTATSGADAGTSFSKLRNDQKAARSSAEASLARCRMTLPMKWRSLRAPAPSARPSCAGRSGNAPIPGTTSRYSRRFLASVPG